MNESFNIYLTAWVFEISCLHFNADNDTHALKYVSALLCKLLHNSYRI